MKLIEIVGEAAAHVSPEGQQRTPSVPWRMIIDTRNRLIHGYYDIDVAVVVSTVRNNFPPLIASLERELQL